MILLYYDLNSDMQEEYKQTLFFWKVDPKFLRNLRFSKKHNVRRPNVAAQKPAAPAVQAAKPQKK